MEIQHEDCVFLKDKTKWNLRINNAEKAIFMLSDWKSFHEESATRRENKIQELDRKIDTMKNSQLNIDNKLDSTNVKLDSMLEILNGNGKVGLCAKVNLLWGGFALVIVTSVATIIRTFWNG